MLLVWKGAPADRGPAPVLGTPQVYEMAVDTILLSFCEDCDEHNGTPLYAPPLLLAAIGESQASIEKKRQKMEDKIKGAKNPKVK